MALEAELRLDVPREGLPTVEEIDAQRVPGRQMRGVQVPMQALTPPAQPRSQKLSQEAWLIDEKMREAHRRAATAIFSQRNKAWVDMRAFGQAPEKEPVLDLHGLHVAEAVELLSSELPVASDIGIQSVHVLVGTQHHTAGKHSQGLAAGERGESESRRRCRNSRRGSKKSDRSCHLLWVVSNVSAVVGAVCVRAIARTLLDQVL